MVVGVIHRFSPVGVSYVSSLHHAPGLVHEGSVEPLTDSVQLWSVRWCHHMLDSLGLAELFDLVVETVENLVLPSVNVM